MRCILGLVLCISFCAVGIQGLYAIATAYEQSNNPGLPYQAAQAEGWKVVVKYHAHVYAVSGLLALAICCLPTLLAKHSGFNEEDEWARVAKTEGR